MKHLVLQIFIITIFSVLSEGCIGYGPNTRLVADILDNVPLGEKLTINDACIVTAENANIDSKKIKVHADGMKVDSVISPIILSMNTNCSFFRIYPDDLFFTLNDDDIVYSCDVAVPVNSPDGLVIFMSPEFEFKGYCGNNNHVFADDSEVRRRESIDVYESDDVVNVKSALIWLDELNDKNTVNEEGYYVLPKLPFPRKSLVDLTQHPEYIIGRIVEK